MRPSPVNAGVLPWEGTGRSPAAKPPKACRRHACRRLRRGLRPVLHPAAARKEQKGRTAAFSPGAAYPSSATMMELESRKPRSVSAMRSSPARSSPASRNGSARRSRAV